jgi:hypothetical protein
VELNLDILGAERRLAEYEAVLYMRLTKTKQMKKNDCKRKYGDRLPVNSFQHVDEFIISFPGAILGKVGSQRLIQYYLHCDKSELDLQEIFQVLCGNGHLAVAQWLFSVEEIHDNDDEAFLCACMEGHLLVAQWLHSIGRCDIHYENDQAFRDACEGGHLSVAQWLHSFGSVDIHGNNDEAFLWHVLMVTCN